VTTRDGEGNVISDKVVSATSKEALDVNPATLTFRAPPEVAPPVCGLAIAALRGEVPKTAGGPDLPVALAHPPGPAPELCDGAFTVAVEGDEENAAAYWLTALHELPEEPDLAVLAGPGADISRDEAEQLLRVLREDPSTAIVFPCSQQERLYGPPEGAAVFGVRAGLLLAGGALSAFDGDVRDTMRRLCRVAVRNRYRIRGVEMDGAASAPDDAKSRTLAAKYPDPDATFVIPAYNAERWIADAVESALEQVGADTDVVVVDDGSKDGTLEELLELRRQHGPRVIIMTQPNSGPSAARNYGVRRALGDVLIFLDADDIAPPNRTRLSLEALEGADICVGQVRMFEEGGAPENAIDVGRIAAPTPETIIGHAGGFRIGCAATRRRLHEDLGVWLDEEMDGSEDYEFAIAATAAGARWATIDEPTLLRRNVRSSRRRREGLNKPLLKKWAIFKHRDFLENYAAEDLDVSNEEVFHMRALRARALAQQKAAAAPRSAIAEALALDEVRDATSWTTEWRGFPGPPAPPAPGEPVRVLIAGVRAAHAGGHTGTLSLVKYLDPARHRVRILVWGDATHAEEFTPHAEVRACPTDWYEGLARPLDEQEMLQRFVRREVFEFRPHCALYFSPGLCSDDLVDLGVPTIARLRSMKGTAVHNCAERGLGVRVSEAVDGSEHFITLGVEPTAGPVDWKREEGLILWAGRGDRDREPEPFLDALKLCARDLRARGARVVIAGEAMFREWNWKEQLDHRGISDIAEPVGHLPREELLDRMKRADVLAAPIPESFGNAVAEAMMRGVVPLVATAGFGPAMVGELGLTCNPGDPRDIANKLLAALESPLREERQQIAERARRLFDARRAAREYGELFDQLVAPLVDVVIVAHGHRSVTEMAVSSVIDPAATRWPIHLVLCDSGSDDDTLDYCHAVQDFLGEDRVTVLHWEENIGAPHARWAALDHCRGKYVAWLDNDNAVSAGWLPPLVGVLERNPSIGRIGMRMADDRRLGSGWDAARGYNRAVALYRRRALEDAVLDEELADLHSAADSDLCLSMADAGWELARHHGVTLYHVGDLTRSQLDPERLRAGYERFREKRMR
jgi:glycosyltransferase involved in cell wall biosynthesis